MYDIIFYEKPNGICPVQEFLDALTPKLLAKTLKTIDLLELFGPELRGPYSSMLEDGIFELRAKQGQDITRILYFFIASERVVLTNGFVKKTEKTPTNHKELAKKYRVDYMWRDEHEKL